MKTLTRQETETLADFAYQASQWQRTHGEKADKVLIDYSAEEDGYLIETNEKTSKRRRKSLFEAEIIQWAQHAINRIEYDGKAVDVLVLKLENDSFSIELTLKDKAADAEPVAESAEADGEEAQDEQDGEAES